MGIHSTLFTPWTLSKQIANDPRLVIDVVCIRIGKSLKVVLLTLATSNFSLPIVIEIQALEEKSFVVHGPFFWLNIYYFIVLDYNKS